MFEYVLHRCVWKHRMLVEAPIEDEELIYDYLEDAVLAQKYFECRDEINFVNHKYDYYIEHRIKLDYGRSNKLQCKKIKKNDI